MVADCRSGNSSWCGGHRQCTECFETSNASLRLRLRLQPQALGLWRSPDQLIVVIIAVAARSIVATLRLASHAEIQVANGNVQDTQRDFDIDLYSASLLAI